MLCLLFQCGRHLQLLESYRPPTCSWMRLQLRTRSNYFTIDITIQRLVIGWVKSVSWTLSVIANKDYTRHVPCQALTFISSTSLLAWQRVRLAARPVSTSHVACFHPCCCCRCCRRRLWSCWRCRQLLMARRIVWSWHWMHTWWRSLYQNRWPTHPTACLSTKIWLLFRCSAKKKYLPLRSGRFVCNFCSSKTN